jgi:hypothetical protein
MGGNTVTLWEAATGKEVVSFWVPGGQVEKVVLTRDSKRLVTANWDEKGIVMVWNMVPLLR